MIGDEQAAGWIEAVSDVNIKALLPAQKMKSRKQVGVFYFVLSGTEPQKADKNYDNSKILKKIDFTGKTKLTLPEWRAAGGGGKHVWHWWGEPLFDFYDMLDEWVITRHVEMLTDACVDFIVIDLTNGVLNGYIERIELLFEILYKYYKQGFAVPQVCFMAYDDGPKTLNKLYKQFYELHPEYQALFYHWNNHEKPVIFDNISGYNRDASAQINEAEKLASYIPQVTDMFEIRDVAFPHETVLEHLLRKSFIYLDCREQQAPVPDPEDNGYSFSTVALAEIRTGRSTNQWFSDTKDRTRNFDGQRNRHWYGENDAYLYGYNFAREFEQVLQQDPDMVFITGWNEWFAHLNELKSGAISLVDNADINNSRDMEPMKEGYGDNYYIQMCHYIGRFKYGTPDLKPAEHCTVDMTTGDFTQWMQEGILSFSDYVGEQGARNHPSAYEANLIYTEPAGVNDFKQIKVTSDESQLYFYLETEAPICGKSIALLLNTGTKINWHGYDYRVCQNQDGALCLSRYTEENLWEDVCMLSSCREGCKMMLAIPRNLLGISAGVFQLRFKWADSYNENDFWSFYTKGDMAPYGRFNYLYCGK